MTEPSPPLPATPNSDDRDPTDARTPNVLLQARNLKRVGRDGSATLLDVEVVQIASGERWALSGPTGAGKSLLLRALALLDPPDAGEIHWQGRPVANSEVPAFRRRVVYLQQRPALIEGSVETNLRLPFSFQTSRDSSFDRDASLTQLARLGLDGRFLDKDSATLSGGEAQITAILCAVQLEPIVILLDEPTAALDEHSTSLVEQLVSRWFHESPAERALVWVSHDSAQRDRIAEGRLQLAGGRIVSVSRTGSS